MLVIDVGEKPSKVSNRSSQSEHSCRTGAVPMDCHEFSMCDSFLTTCKLKTFRYIVHVCVCNLVRDVARCIIECIGTLDP